jgi:hypothetical protein
VDLDTWAQGLVQTFLSRDPRSPRCENLGMLAVPDEGAPRRSTSRRRPLPGALNTAAIAALIAAATAGKALVDDDCAKKAVAELTRD